MSLLNRGTEVVKVFHQVAAEERDRDGNRVSRPSVVGVVRKAVVQPISSTEDADGGYNTAQRYRLRLVNYPEPLGPRSQIEWRGKRYSIDGNGVVYSGSPRTARTEYVMVRS